MDTLEISVTKTLVATPERLSTLPRYLGKHYLEFEMSVYGFMDRFCQSYNGGYWDYYKLSNGGFFKCLSVSVGVNIFAPNALLWGDQTEAKIFDLYDDLRDYAAEIPGEAEKIRAFIDYFVR